MITPAAAPAGTTTMMTTARGPDDDDDRPRSRRRYDEDDDDRPRRPRDDDDDYPRRGPRRGGYDQPKKGGKGVVIALSIVGVLLLVCGGGGVAAYFFGRAKVRDASVRLKAQNNLKQIGIASHSYHDAHDRIHAPFHEDPAARFQPALPSNLSDRLSWRVSLLPFIEQDHLYRRVAASEPWNSSTNRSLADVAVEQYSDPDARTDPATRIRLFCDNGALFDTDTRRRTTFASVTDGTSNTIAYVESSDKVGWTQSNDFRFDTNGTLPQLGHPNRTVIHVMMVDGSVRAVRKTISPETLKAAITRSGGEMIRLDD